jgi:hypothetical protein
LRLDLFQDSDPLGGGVSPKRVAARLWLAEEFGLGSVSAHDFQCRRVQARGFRHQQISGRLTIKPEVFSRPHALKSEVCSRRQAFMP